MREVLNETQRLRETVMAKDDDIELLQQLIGYGGTQIFAVIPAALKKIILEKQWRDRLDKNGKPFTSFEAFVTHRLWQGLESSIADLRVYCRKQPEIERLVMAEVEPLSTPGGRRERNVFGISFNKQYGTSATYLFKRLKRDHPHLFQQVLDGKLSAKVAAVEAGILAKPSPFKQMLKLLPKLTSTEWEQVRAQGDDLFAKLSRSG